jgi:hypothetical protein
MHRHYVFTFLLIVAAVSFLGCDSATEFELLEGEWRAADITFLADYVVIRGDSFQEGRIVDEGTLDECYEPYDGRYSVGLDEKGGYALKRGDVVYATITVSEDVMRIEVRVGFEVESFRRATDVLGGIDECG